MTETQIKSVALFFYLTLLDEELAEKACELTIQKCRSRLKKNTLSESESTSIVIHLISSIFEKMKSDHILNKASLNSKSNYILTNGISLGAWRQFHKESTSEELVAVVLSQILEFDEATIAGGLGLTIGSVRYRVGRGLRQLGHLITLGERIA